MILLTNSIMQRAVIQKQNKTLISKAKKAEQQRAQIINLLQEQVDIMKHTKPTTKPTAPELVSGTNIDKVKQNNEQVENLEQQMLNKNE